MKKRNNVEILSKYCRMNTVEIEKRNTVEIDLAVRPQYFTLKQ
jgi:hypothetical protein